MRRDKVRAARRRVAAWEEPQKSPRGADFDIGLTPDRRERRREGGGGEAGRTGRPFLCGEAEFD